MNPSDFHNDPSRFRLLIRNSWQSPRHRYGSPALGNLTSDTCHPCYPDGSLVRLPLPAHQHCGLPYTGTRSATAFSLRGYFWVHLSLRPTSLSFRNLRPSIARTPLLRATKAHGQLLGRDFNPLAKLLLLRTPGPFDPIISSIEDGALRILVVKVGNRREVYK
jgi:hypothetical protein